VVSLALDRLPTSSSSLFSPLNPARREDLSSTDVTAPPADDLAGNPRYQLYEFHSEILPGDRTVQVYLPPQYMEEQDRRFPVFYLHDGQNLFDGRTSYIPGRTWNANATADRLTLEEQIEPVILVGVANTGLQRMAEYTPTRDMKMGGGDGRNYGRLLVEELKPWIDRSFQTLVGAGDTGLGGSSLGGLISLYLGWEYPAVFGKLAVMSPSLWWDHRSILSIINQPGPKPDLRIWMDMGTAEGTRHVRDADLLEQMLIRRGWQLGVDLAYEKAKGAVHDEQAWGERFGDVLRFLFPAG
jgi:predicted alpha/beta superfamily hydrolase